MSFPKPRLPQLVGAAETLPAQLSVYPTINIDLPISYQQATIAAGAVAAVFNISDTIIASFPTRFVGFREFLILGARFELRLNNVANTAGYVLAYIDEKSAGVPTGTEATSRPRLDMICGPLFDRKPYRLDWMPRDYLDLQYTTVGTSQTPAYLKVFGSTATGLVAGTTGEVIISGSLAIQFRGLA